MPLGHGGILTDIGRFATCLESPAACRLSGVVTRDFIMTSRVRSIPAAANATAAAHFEGNLALETDCWDVHDALSKGGVDFVLIT